MFNKTSQCMGHNVPVMHDRQANEGRDVPGLVILESCFTRVDLSAAAERLLFYILREVHSVHYSCNI